MSKSLPRFQRLQFMVNIRSLLAKTYENLVSLRQVPLSPWIIPTTSNNTLFNKRKRTARRLRFIRPEL